MARIGAGAVMRSVGADLEACTPVGQRLGDQAGGDVLSRLRAFEDLPVGGAVVTPGGGLGSDLLIHVVIRSSEEPVSDRRLSSAFQNGLRRAAEWEIEVLAVPPLGVGAGNLDAETSARIMCSVAKKHSLSHSFPQEVVILAGNDYEEEVFAREARRTFDVTTG